MGEGGGGEIDGDGGRAAAESLVKRNTKLQ